MRLNQKIYKDNAIFAQELFKIFQILQTFFLKLPFFFFSIIFKYILKPKFFHSFRILFSIQKSMKSPINYKPNQPSFIQNRHTPNHNGLIHNDRILFDDRKSSRNTSPAINQLSPSRRIKIKLVSPMKVGRSVMSPRLKENQVNTQSLDSSFNGREACVNNTRRTHLKTKSQLQTSQHYRNLQNQSIRNTEWRTYDGNRYAHKHPSQKYSPFVIVSANPSPSQSPTKIVINQKPLLLGSLQSQIIYVAPFQHIKRQKISVKPKLIQKNQPIQESIYIFKQKQQKLRQTPMNNPQIIENLQYISDIRKDIEVDNLRFKQILSSSRASRRTTNSRLEDYQANQQAQKIANIYQQQINNQEENTKHQEGIDSKTTLIYELRGLTNTKVSLKHHQCFKFDISVQTQQTNSQISMVKTSSSPFQKKDRLFLVKNSELQLQLSNTPEEINNIQVLPLQSFSQRDDNASEAGQQVDKYGKNILQQQEKIAFIQLQKTSPLECSPMKYSQSFIKHDFDRNHQEKQPLQKRQVQLDRSIIREHQSLFKIEQQMQKENKYRKLIEKQEKLQQMFSSISLKFQDQRVTKTVPQLQIITSIKQIKKDDILISQRIVRQGLQGKSNKQTSKKLKNKLYL